MLLRRLKELSRRTETILDDLLVAVLEKTRPLFLVILAMYAASIALQLSRPILQIIQIIALISLLLQTGMWGSGAIAFLIERKIRLALREGRTAATSVTAFGFLSRFVLWSVILLAILDNLGVNITGLAAGLGIGGIAVALAVQNILGDLFASLSIVLDKPFVIGDFIVVDQYMGNVEHIGLKTTRLRSLSGEQVVFSNTDLLKSRIRNYKRMYERRVVFTVAVPYHTSPEKLGRVSTLLRGIVEMRQKVRFDRAHLKEFGESAILYEAAYYVQDSDYNIYMDIQESINLQIIKDFNREGIEFAYPTQTLFVHNDRQGRRRTADSVRARPRRPGKRESGTSRQT